MEAKNTKGIEERIIEAAKQVFVRKGYVAATMGDVANEAGIGRTALHYYYRTKEILFDAVFEQLSSSFLPNIDRILDQERPFIEKLPSIIDIYMGIIRANPSFPQFVIGELNRDRNHVFQTILKNPETIRPVLRLRQQVEDEMEQGLIRKIPIVDLVTTVVSLAVFPMLIREPLQVLFLNQDPKLFEEFIERRKTLIIETAVRLITPNAKQV